VAITGESADHLVVVENECLVRRDADRDLDVLVVPGPAAVDGRRHGRHQRFGVGAGSRLTNFERPAYNRPTGHEGAIVPV
jgi:hypothetical protein